MTSSKVSTMSKTKPRGKIDDSRLPDGGWGWMVVLGVAVTNMFNQSLVSVFGLLFGQHLEEMGYESTGVALVSNVNNMVMCFSGLVTGPVLQRYSCRSVSIFGSMLTFIGLVMCSFATTIEELLVFYSCLTGVGLGLIYPATFVAIKAYFAGRRARAVGLSMAGTGIGQMLMPQLVRWLLDEYGFCGSVRIVAALCLHGAVGSMLYQPVHWHLKPIPNDTEKLLNNNNSFVLPMDEFDKQKKVNGKKEISNSQEKEKLANGYNSHKETEENNESEEKESRPWYSFFHFSLLRDLHFTNLCLGLGLVHTAGVSFSTLFPLLLQEGTVKLSRSDTALAMSLLSAADILARVTIPLAMWRLGVSSRGAFWIGALLLAGARSESRPWYSFFHFSLLRAPHFTNLCLGLGLVHTAGVSFSTLFPLLLQEGTVKLSRSDTALAMSLLSAADILARVTIPLAMWRLGVSSRGAFWIGALLLAGARSESRPWYSFFHFSLLRAPHFTNLCLRLGLVHTAGVSFSTLFPLLLQEGTVKLSRSDTALAMSLLSAADILARVTIPLAMWRLGVSSRGAFWIGALLLAGARSVIALQTNLLGMFAASLLCGYIRAFTVINQNLTVSEYCSRKGLDEKLPAALGIMMVAKGVFVISLGQLLGWLRDYTKSYNLFVYGTNVLLVVVFITWGVEFIITKMKKSKEEAITTCES